MFKNRLLIFCFILATMAAKAQHCQIKGDVLERSTVTKLDSVKIEIYEGNMMYKIIYTDSSGQYDTRMFQVVSPVSFRITRPGYEKKQLRFGKLKGNNVIFMDIELRKITNEELKKRETKLTKNGADSKNRKKRYARVKRRTALPF